MDLELYLMLENLFVTAAVVILLWIIILGIFVIISRKQPDIQARMKTLEEQLIKTEKKGKQR
jgi:hypothetical protein